MPCSLIHVNLPLLPRRKIDGRIQKFWIENQLEWILTPELSLSAGERGQSVGCVGGVERDCASARS